MTAEWWGYQEFEIQGSGPYSWSLQVLEAKRKPKGKKPRSQSGKAGAGSFPRDEAIEKVREFESMYIFNWSSEIGVVLAQWICFF